MFWKPSKGLMTENCFNLNVIGMKEAMIDDSPCYGSFVERVIYDMIHGYSDYVGF